MKLNVDQFVNVCRRFVEFDGYTHLNIKSNENYVFINGIDPVNNKKINFLFFKDEYDKNIVDNIAVESKKEDKMLCIYSMIDIPDDIKKEFTDKDIAVISGDPFLKLLDKRGIFNEPNIGNEPALPSKKYYQNLIDNAEQFEKEGNYNRAMELYHEIVKIKPEMDLVWIRMARIYINNNEPEKALEAYRNATEANPSEVENWYYLANTLHILNRFLEEIECYDIIINMNKYEMNAYINKAAALYNINRLNDAIDLLNNAMNVKPTPEIENNLGVMYKRTGNYEMAVNMYKKAIKQAPDFIDAYVNLAIIEYDNKIFDDAEKILESLYVKMKRADIVYLYAITLFEKKKYKLVEKLYSELVNMNAPTQYIDDVKLKMDKITPIMNETVSEIDALIRIGEYDMVEEIIHKNPEYGPLISYKYDDRSYLSDSLLSYILEHLKKNEKIDIQYMDKLKNITIKNGRINSLLLYIYILFMNKGYTDIIEIIEMFNVNETLKPLLQNIKGIAHALSDDKINALNNFSSAIKIDPLYEDLKENIDKLRGTQNQINM